MRVLSESISSKRTSPEVSTSPPTLFQPIPRSGFISVVLASNSTLVPTGPWTFQWLLSWSITRTSSTLLMISGKCSRLDQYSKTTLSGARTSTLSCTRWGIYISFRRPGKGSLPYPALVPGMVPKVCVSSHCGHQQASRSSPNLDSIDPHPACSKTNAAKARPAPPGALVDELDTCAVMLLVPSMFDVTMRG